MTAADFRNNFYGNYVKFKGWNRPAENWGSQYTTELGRAGVASGARILEIGFGQGGFLDWAVAQGYTVTGVEIIESLVACARARKHDVLYGQVWDVLPVDSRKFDLVVAFDVLEHLSLEEITHLLTHVAGLLAPGGKVLARFPNGASPFGALYQNGDATHVTVLSPTRIDQIARRAGLRMTSAQNAARTLGRSRLPSGVKRLRFFLRDCIEKVVGALYYGEVIPLDPNVTVVLERES